MAQYRHLNLCRLVAMVAVLASILLFPHIAQAVPGVPGTGDSTINVTPIVVAGVALVVLAVILRRRR